MSFNDDNQVSIMKLISITIGISTIRYS